MALPSDPSKHQHSTQSRALRTNTQGSQGERKGEGELFVCFLFFGMKPENPYFASHPGFIVKPALVFGLVYRHTANYPITAEMHTGGVQ